MAATESRTCEQVRQSLSSNKQGMEARVVIVFEENTRRCCINNGCDHARAGCRADDGVSRRIVPL